MPSTSTSSKSHITTPDCTKGCSNPTTRDLLITGLPGERKAGGESGAVDAPYCPWQFSNCADRNSLGSSR